MNIDQLNSRFGAPGRIVFRIGHCGYPEAVLASRFGVAEVALLGGNVLSLLADDTDAVAVCGVDLYPKENIRTIIQRVSAALILPMLFLHIKL